MKMIKAVKESDNPSSEKLFKSRFTLTFVEDAIEKAYGEGNKPEPKVNCIMSGNLFIFFLIVQIIVTLKREDVKILNKHFVGYSVISSIALMAMLWGVVSYFIRKLRTNWISLRIILGVNLISLSILSHFITSMLRDFNMPELQDIQSLFSFPDETFIINMISYFAQLFYAFFAFDRFVNLFLSSVLNICLHWPICYLILPERFIIYSISHCLASVFLIVAFYVKDFIMRSQYYLQIKQCAKTEQKDLSYMSTAIDNLRHPYFCIDTKGEICCLNKAAKKLVRHVETVSCGTNKLSANDLINCELESYETSPNEFVNIIKPDYWKIFKSNEFFYFHPQSSKPAVLSKGYYDNETKILEQIMNELVVINEELPVNISRYFKDNKSKRKASGQANVPQETNESNDFNFSKFYSLLNPDSKTVRDSLFSKNININFGSMYNKADFESEFQNSKLIGGSTMLAKSSINNLSLARDLSQSPLKKTIHPTHVYVSSRSKGIGYNNDEYIYLGKSLLDTKQKVGNDGSWSKELFIYYRLSDGMLEFLIEDNSNLIFKDRRETILTCRSLFLSKMAHEFRNPICNILEIINSISEDFDRMNGIIQSENSEPESDISDYSQSVSKFLKRKSEKDREREYGNKPTITQSSINPKATKHLTMLRNVSEMMLLLIKDFTFYSMLTDDIESELKAPSDKKDSSTKISCPPERLVPKICEYKKVISEISNMFSMKAKMNFKEQKLRFLIKIPENLPDRIECDQELFTALIFNLIYHTYKTTHKGTITINVRVMKSIPSGRRSFVFEIIIIGSSIPSPVINIIKGDELIKKLQCKDIDEIIEEEHSLSNNQRDIHKITSAILLKNEGITVNKCKIEEKGRDSSTTVLNYKESFPMEHFHLKKLFQTSNAYQRNLIIEEFNHNFSICISHAYAQKLGTELRIESNRQEAKISFCLNNVDLLAVNNLQDSLSMRAIEVQKEDEIKKVIGSSEHCIVGRTSRMHQSMVVNNYQINVAMSPVCSHNLESETNKTDHASKESKQTLINNDKMLFNYSKFRKSAAQVPCFPEMDFSVVNAKEREISSRMKRNPLLQITSRPPEFTKERSASNVFYSKQNRRKSRFSRTSSIVNNFTCVHPVRGPRQTMNDSSIMLSTFNIDMFSKDNEVEKEVRVLLVDDESFVRKGLNRFLNRITKEKDMIFDVLHAENGFECLEILYRHLIDGKYIDALIIDENMPYLKGTQIIKLLRGIMDVEFASMVIISYTSYDSQECKDYILGQGADYVLNKPMKYDDFKKFFLNVICKSE